MGYALIRLITTSFPGTTSYTMNGMLCSTTATVTDGSKTTGIDLESYQNLLLEK